MEGSQGEFIVIFKNLGLETGMKVALLTILHEYLKSFLTCSVIIDLDKIRVSKYFGGLDFFHTFFDSKWV